MIARLHRFYGPAPHPSGDWLMVRPALIAAYVAQLPRLRAEEQLTSVVTGQVAAGVAKPAQARQIVSRLERDASRGRSRKRKPADPRKLRAAGINVEHRTVDRG